MFLHVGDGRSAVYRTYTCLAVRGVQQPTLNLETEQPDPSLLGPESVSRLSASPSADRPSWVLTGFRAQSGRDEIKPPRRRYVGTSRIFVDAINVLVADRYINYRAHMAEAQDASGLRARKTPNRSANAAVQLIRSFPNTITIHSVVVTMGTMNSANTGKIIR